MTMTDEAKGSEAAAASATAAKHHSDETESKIDSFLRGRMPPDKWEESFVKLEALSRSNGGDANFLKSCDNFDKGLYDWAQDQRKAYKEGALSEDKAGRLESIGLDFHWDPRTAVSDAKWDKMFVKLEALSRSNGGNANFLKDCDNFDKGLYDWAQDQRKAYKEGALSEDKTGRLESIGLDFHWNPLMAKNEAKWDKMYGNLIEYHKEHGNFYVPFHYKTERHGPLGNWVCDVKLAAAGKCKKKLSKERAAKLGKIGFDFRLMHQLDAHYDNKFEKSLKDFLDYKSANDGEAPPAKSTLGNWCKEQRRKHRAGTLDETRTKKLLDAGFDFTVGEKNLRDRSGRFQAQTSARKKWETMFRTLLCVCHVSNELIENGHCNIARLASWFDNLKDKKLPDYIYKNHLKRAGCKKNVTLSDLLTSCEDEHVLSKAYLLFHSEKGQLASKLSRKVLTDIGEAIGNIEVQKLMTRRAGSNTTLKMNNNIPALGKETNDKVNSDASEEPDSHADVQCLHVVEESIPLKVDLKIAVSPGHLGFSARFDGMGCLVTALHPLSLLRDHISVGDRLITIDGAFVMNEERIFKECDKQRMFGFSRKKDPPNKKPTAEEDRTNQRQRLEKAGFALAPKQSHKKEPIEESVHWELQCCALNAYVQEHGDAPQSREENPSLYDWLQLQKARQNRLEEVLSSF